jgi:hypothetical protein
VLLVLIGLESISIEMFDGVKIGQRLTEIGIGKPVELFMGFDVFGTFDYAFFCEFLIQIGGEPKHPHKFWTEKVH